MEKAKKSGSERLQREEHTKNNAHTHVHTHTHSLTYSQHERDDATMVRNNNN